MRKNSLLYITLALIVLLGVLNYIALSLHLYWTVWWFDILMHFLAGFSGAMFIIWIVGEPGTPFRSILVPILCLMLVGVAWEIFEYIHGIAGAMENYAVDTTTDLFMDALGALSATTIVSRFLKSS